HLRLYRLSRHPLYTSSIANYGKERPINARVPRSGCRRRACNGVWQRFGVPIVAEKKTTNLVWDPSSAAFCLLETRLRGEESRNRIREWLSIIKFPQDLANAT